MITGSIFQKLQYKKGNIFILKEVVST